MESKTMIDSNRTTWVNFGRVNFALSSLLLWLTQPPLAWWPLVWVSLVPWLLAVVEPTNSSKNASIRWLYFAAFAYWLVTLQGLRHAHPAIYIGWILLAGYLAIYPVCFFLTTRYWFSRGVPLLIVAPLAWVGWECVRNYMLTGISAAMLGHTLANVPQLIQIADFGGSYVVSFLIVLVNVAVVDCVGVVRSSTSKRTAVASVISATVCVMLTVVYGSYRLSEPTAAGSTRVLLVGRDEPVEFDNDEQREAIVFQKYARQSVDTSIGRERIDVVVWPESMFTGTVPWRIMEENAAVPAELDASVSEFAELIELNRTMFQDRASALQRAIAQSVPQSQSPHLIVGCGVVRYADVPLAYSGIVHIGPDGKVVNWYGKNHLVMIGEYIPLVASIPGVREWVPPGLGVQTGHGAVAFEFERASAGASICIETAVERVTINHTAQLRRLGAVPEFFITVTNDGWFDRTSVVEHHLRCAQFVAIGSRRPILSAANGGPTAWIDSNGQVVQRLDAASNGSILAEPRIDPRESIYVRIGDWPVRIAAIVCMVSLGMLYLQRRRAVA